MNRWSRCKRQAVWRVAAVVGTMACVLLLMPNSYADGSPSDRSGSSKTQSKLSSSKYTTTVDRETQGELSPDDFRQVSTLASQVLMHIGSASDFAVSADWQRAKEELRHAECLGRLIRDMLPTTKVTTVVKDASGKEVYRYQETLQSDKIPLFDGMVAVDILQAVVEKKQEEASLKGVRLADAQLIHTSARLNLPYVERKISRALSLIDEKAEEAVAQLLYAQSRGVEFAVQREDDPLVKAQSAIRLAERMAREGKHEAADENLRLAKLHLETYRSLLGEQANARVRQLQSDIQALAGKTQEAGAQETMRGFWDRVAGWFRDEPGTARVTTESAGQEQQVSTSDRNEKQAGAGG